MRNDARDDFDSVPTLHAIEEDDGVHTAGARERTTVYSRTAPVIKVKAPGTGLLWAFIGALLLAIAGLAWWSFQQISLMEQQLVATQESFARISEEAAGRLQAISGKVVASESSLNTGSEALKLQIKQLEEQLLEQSKRQQVAVEGQKVELDARFEKINAALLAQAAEFDVFRAQVTRNINTLQSQIQNLQKQISARP